MKIWKWIPAILLLCLTGCAAKVTPTPIVPVIPVTPTNPDWTIGISFNYDFTNYNICGAATPTRGCITNFVWGYLQNGAQVPLKTAPASICTGSTQPESCTDTANSTLGIGNVTFFATANGLDNSGAAISSAPAQSAPQMVPFASATNVVGTLK